MINNYNNLNQSISLPYLAEELWCHIFSYLNDVEVGRIKQTCRIWKRMSNNVTPPMLQIVRENIEQIRHQFYSFKETNLLTNNCRLLLLGERGDLQALGYWNRNDISFNYLNADAKVNKRYLFEFNVRHLTMNPHEMGIFQLTNVCQEPLPNYITKIATLMLRELNKLAKNALEVSKRDKIIELNIHNSTFYVPLTWHNIILNFRHEYPIKALLNTLEI